MRLGKGRDRQSPKSEKADDSLGLETSDRNVHGLFVVDAYRQAKECRHQCEVNDERGFLPGWTVVPGLLWIEWVEGQRDTQL